MGRKIFLIVALALYACVFFVGLSFFHLATKTPGLLKASYGRVIKKSLSEYISTKGGHFFDAVFTVAGWENKIVVSLHKHSYASAVEDSVFLRIDTGKVYAFYLDTSYLNINGNVPVVIAIKDANGKQLFRQSASDDLLGGTILCLMSAGAFVLALWLYRRYKIMHPGTSAQ